MFLFLGGDTGIELELKEKPNDMPLVKHKEVEYLGMFEYKKEDEPVIIKNLIYGMLLILIHFGSNFMIFVNTVNYSHIQLLL